MKLVLELSPNIIKPQLLIIFLGNKVKFATEECIYVLWLNN